MKNLSYKTKNKILPAGLGLLLLLSWFLAFNKTADAVSMYRRLSGEAIKQHDLAYSPVYLSSKVEALDKILNRYQADSADWKNEFWLKVSGAAADKGLEVIYRPEAKRLSEETDSVSMKQSIQFRGEFKGLVQLLDSLEHMAGIGRIVSAGLQKETRRGAGEGMKKIILETEFKAIGR